MRATSEAVEKNKVRLSVEIDEPEVDQVLAGAIGTMSRRASVPGFRPGKVPRQVLEARMGGAGALRAEALREAIPDFYAKALAEAGIDPISAPEIDITAGEESGALAFDALVDVRPVVAIPGYAGLAVTVPSPEVSDADVDAQLDRMRDTEAQLVDVSRSARDADHVTIDLHGSLQGGEEVVAYDDLLYEVGSGQVVPGLDDQLRGAKVGDVLEFTEPVPAPSTGEGPDAGQIAFRVLVKDVKEKKLPTLTDEWAAESSEFSTVAELKADLRTRLHKVKVVRARMSLRQSAVAALTELVEDEEVPSVLVDEELRQRLHDLAHRLEEQGIGIAQLLDVTGRSEEEMTRQMREEALRAVKADLALRALADAEEIEVTDEELDAELESMANRLSVSPAVVRDRLTRAGRLAAVRSEQRNAKALAWLLDHVEMVDDEGRAVPRDFLQESEGTGEEDHAALDGEGSSADTTDGEAAG